MTTTVSNLDSSRLNKIEAELEDLERANFVRRGELYEQVRDSKAYKHEYQTFDDYIEQRWEIDRSRCYQIIDASAFTRKLEMSTTVDFLPLRERQVRPLLRTFPDSFDLQAMAWERAVAAAADKHKITSKDVIAEANKLKAELEKDWITLDEWQTLSKDERQAQLVVKGKGTLNKQDNTSIEWAQWSWNPITGCRHDCPYCYARDIANRFYPAQYGFEPTIHPNRLAAPYNTKVPSKDDPSYKNIFACSMADLFGRWVPTEWIETVFDVVRDNEQWNFLFLTKFPKRMAEFDIPHNAWMGTTVDCQKRVKAAEDAFKKIKCDVKWLSIEPMLEPLKFSALDMFDWVVIGGASRSNETPAFVPPLDWVAPLHLHARKSGCAIYYKDNGPLMDEARLREFPWDKKEIPLFAPDQFKYLGQE